MANAAVMQELATKLRSPAAPSLADMYRDILPAGGGDGGLTSRKVQTVKIDGEGNPILGGGTTYFPRGPAYGYNSLTGDYEVQQPGNAYAVGSRPNFDYPVSPAAAAIETAAPNLASLFAAPSANQPNGMPVDSSVPLNMGGGAPAAAAPAPQPKSPIQTLAEMFTPAPVATSDPRRGQTISTQNHGNQVVGQRLNGSERGRTVTGDDWFNSVRGL